MCKSFALKFRKMRVQLKKNWEEEKYEHGKWLTMKYLSKEDIGIAETLLPTTYLHRTAYTSKRLDTRGNRHFCKRRMYEKTNQDRPYGEFNYLHCQFVKWNLKLEHPKATLRTGCSSVTTGHWGKMSPLLGETQVWTSNKKTCASHLLHRFCYSLGVYDDRKQIVNVPFKLLIAFWKQSTCGKRDHETGEKPMVSQSNRKEKWQQATMHSPASGAQKRQPALLLAKPCRCLWWQMATAPPVPPPVQRQQPGTAAMHSSTWQGPVELVMKMHKVHKHVVSHQGLREECKHNSHWSIFLKRTHR